MLKLLSTVEGHEERVWHASWSPDGTKVASCGEDKTIRIWRVNASSSVQVECIAVLEEAQSRTIRCCEWSPNGRVIASASFDGTVIVWEAQDPTLTRWDRIATLEGHENEVKSVAWNKSGSFLATCGRDKKIWVWERAGKHDFECLGVLDGHTQDVKFIKWHPTTSTLFSASYDDTIRIWTEDDGEFYATKTLIGHSSTVWGLDFHPDGKHLVSCSDDGNVFMWENMEQVSSHDWHKMSSVLGAHDYAVYSVDWDQANGTLLATGGGDNAITLIQYEKGEDGFGMIKTVHKEVQAHTGDVNSVRWNPNHDDLNYQGLLLSAGDDGLLKIWSVVV